MNIDINEFKDLVIDNNPRSKIFMFYNVYQLERVKNTSIDVIKNLYSFTLSIAKYISDKYIRTNIENSAILNVQRFDTKEYINNHEYVEFVNEMPRLLGYDYYIIFMLQIYNCIKMKKFVFQSDNELVNAVFNRTKEKCKNLCICSPTMDELVEMINNPDGELCSKYELVVDLDTENKIPNGFSMDCVPYFIRSAIRKNGRTYISKINNTNWRYNRDEYIKVKGKKK